MTGWGVFTTLRLYEGIPFAFERHWDRLERDAALLHVAMPPSRAELRAQLIELARRNGCPEAKLRLNIVRSRGGLFEGPGTGRDSDVLAVTAGLTARSATAALGLQENGRHVASPFAGTKTLSWAHNLTLFENAHRNGYDDMVLLNERGEVSECTSANIFAVLGGVTCTPPLTSGPLPGVTRLVMLRELGERIEERVLLPDDLYGAEEVFITSSTRELMPVARIRERTLQGAATGWRTMLRFRAGLRRYIADYTRAARSA